MPLTGRSPAASEAWTNLIAGYRPAPGVHDALIDGVTGEVRPHMRPVLEAFAALGPEALRARFEAADRQLRGSGVSYRVYGEERDTERAFPLSHVPVVIPATEWQAIAAGVSQRARLLEAVLADLYGPAQLVRDGALPATAVTGSPEFIRPMVGTPPAGGRYLRLYAADLARGPDGRWWVLSDRAQAPSGAGYAVENRIALSRAFPDLIAKLDVQRLAGFFRTVQGALAHSTGRTDPRIAILTPGPFNETHFEHAFLARYLGFLLVEGGDLSVHDGQVYVGTVDGPRRIDLLLRRVDATFCDPLELDGASRIGVPGLLQAVRSGKLVLANALGTGLAEAPALLGFLPALARRLLGEDLLLPNLATWWCGQPRERVEVLRQLERLVIAPAHGRALPGRLDRATPGAQLSIEARQKLMADLARRGADYVGQEAVQLSSTPVWQDGRLVPRPFALRVFAVAGPDGVTVMPGGLARIAPSGDVTALSMQRGGRSADVWVLAADKDAVHETLLPRADVPVRRGPGPLPSRIADNLFWLGRYLERAAATARLVRVLALGRMDVDTRADLVALLRAWQAAPKGALDAAAAISGALSDRTAPGSLPALAGAARRAATVARDRLPLDAWRALVRLDTGAAGGQEGDLVDVADQTLRTLAAVTGFLQDDMTRGAAWSFVDAGRRIERAIAICRFARGLAVDDGSEDALDTLLDLAESQLAYRRRYLVGLAREPVIDLVLLDPANPRSAAFQVQRIREAVGEISPRAPHAPMPVVEADGLRLMTTLATLSAGAVDADTLLAVEGRLMALSDALTARYLVERAPEPDLPDALG